MASQSRHSLFCRRSFSGTCAAKILSAGPCHLYRLTNLYITDTIIPAMIGPLTKSIHFGKLKN